MISLIVGTVAALIIGLATGFYFERRSTVAARQRSADLESQLRTLRESIYAVGRGNSVVGSNHDADDSLESVIVSWLREVQDPEGRVRHGHALAHFMSLGHGGAEVDQVLQGLNDQGAVLVDDGWITVL